MSDSKFQINIQKSIHGNYGTIKLNGKAEIRISNVDSSRFAAEGTLISVPTSNFDIKSHYHPPLIPAPGS